MNAARVSPARVIDEPVRGERGPSMLGATTSMQSRASHALAIGLMLAVGVSMLGWYYSKAIAVQKPAQTAAARSAANRTQNDVPLPPLGHVEASSAASPWGTTRPPNAQRPPTVTSSLTATGSPNAPDGLNAPQATAPDERSMDFAPPAWLAGTPASDDVHAVTALASSAPTAARQNAERRLSGPVYSSGSAASAASPVSAVQGVAAASAPAAGESASPPVDVATVVSAKRLPTTRLLLAKGAFIDCTLETAIDSTLPGMTTCITATDTFGADGTVVLLERGTKLIGELRGQVQHGAARVFVVWNEARTPGGVVVPLVSPGGDELGRAGLPGSVNRHFWERFGAAILISTISGAVQSAVQGSGRGGGAVVYSPTGSQDVMTEVLKSTVGIAPTVVKRQGDRIQVLVARDFDFRTVYELRSLASGR